jgi:hypothetical protein
VITSWSTFARPGDASTVALTVLRPGPGSRLTVTGTTALRQVAPGRLNTFLTRVPVAAGDDLGLHVSISSATQFGCYYLTNEQFDFVSTALASQDSSEPTVGASYDVVSTGNRRINLSAHIEPDADGDGYGDVTQDACPALANSHTDCTAPTTTIVRPGTFTAKGKSAKVSLTFYASESGVTFTCSLDGARAQPCQSPFRAKVTLGKHTLAVVATDAVGNVQASPTRTTFKAKKKKG